MKTALITGGSGFIGSHLCERLLNDSYLVICVDNLLTGSRDNIKEFQDNPNFKFLKHDVTQPISDLHDPISVIINLASPASPKDYQKYPLQTLSAGSLGTENLLKLAKKTGARFVHASTSEVYGDPVEHPQKESYWGNVNTYGPRSMYDEAKRFAEALIYNYRRLYNLDTAIVRIFNTFGPKMKYDDGRVVSNFVVQALKGKPITIYGDGNQTRSFCYIDDMVEGIIKTTETKVQGPINLGNPDEFTIADLAVLIKKLTGSRSKITHLKKPPDDPEQRQPDISKAKTELGWKPKIDLETGLKLTIEWFKQQL